MRHNPNAFFRNLSPPCAHCPPSQSDLCHTCDYVLEANAMLSSIVTIDESEPPFFTCPVPEYNCYFPLTQAQDSLLTTLQGLSTVDVIHTLNNNPSSRILSCKDTVMLMQARQVDGGGPTSP